jgi:hypothetical protein
MRLFFISVLLLHASLVSAQRENPTQEFHEPLVIESDKGPKKDTKEPPDRQGNDGPNDKEKNPAVKEVNTKSRELVKNIVSDYISKYSAIAVETISKQIKANPATFTAFQKSSVKFAGPILMIWDGLNAISDIKEGKWGTGVCFAVGVIPFPYGTAGSFLCSQGLTVIRLYNDTQKPTK